MVILSTPRTLSRKRLGHDGRLGDPIRPRHGPRDLLEVLRLAAAQEPPEFGKVERSLPAGGRLGRNRRRRQGLPLAKPKPSYQATKDHGRITPAWAWLCKTGRPPSWPRRRPSSPIPFHSP